jgi:hypothetical protein
MTADFAPLPWDRPGRVIIDRETFLANLDRLAGTESFLDARSPLMETLIGSLHQDLKRRGIRGMVVASSSRPQLEELRGEGWEVLIGPPASSAQVAEACRKGFSLVIGQVPEAIHASNQAQAYQRPTGVFVRVRSDDLMADHGPGSVLSMIEMLPGLPCLSLRGFFLEAPFSSEQRRLQFLRAMARTVPEIETVTFLAAFSPGEGGKDPAEARYHRLLEHEPLISRPDLGLFPAVLVQGKGFPIAVSDQWVRLEVDLGLEHGIQAIPGETAPVLVEGIPGRVLSVSRRKTLIEVAERPGKGTPWTVTLLGIPEDSPIDGSAGPMPRVAVEFSRLGATSPLYLRVDGVLRELPPVAGGDGSR